MESVRISRSNRQMPGKKWSILLRPLIVFAFDIGFFATLVDLGVSLIQEIELAVMALSFTGWFTLPWAFHERIEKSVNKKVKELTRKGIDDQGIIGSVKQPLVWIQRSRRGFLYSGILIILSLIAQGDQQLFTPSAFLEVEILGGAGLTLFLISCYMSYRVVEYYSNPDYKPAFFAWKSTAFTTILILVEFFAIVPLASVIPQIEQFDRFALISQIYVVSIFASIIGCVWILVVNRATKEDIEKRDDSITTPIPALLLTIWPWLMLAIDGLLIQLRSYLMINTRSISFALFQESNRACAFYALSQVLSLTPRLLPHCIFSSYQSLRNLPILAFSLWIAITTHRQYLNIVRMSLYYHTKRDVETWQLQQSLDKQEVRKSA